MVGQFSNSRSKRISIRIWRQYAQFLYKDRECRRYQHLRLRISLGPFISLIGCLAEILSFLFLCKKKKKKNFSVHIKNINFSFNFILLDRLYSFPHFALYSSGAFGVTKTCIVNPATFPWSRKSAIRISHCFEHRPNRPIFWS